MSLRRHQYLQLQIGSRLGLGYVSVAKLLIVGADADTLNHGRVSSPGYLFSYYLLEAWLCG